MADCKCLLTNRCCMCGHELKSKTETVARKDPYPLRYNCSKGIKEPDTRVHMICDPCEDI